MESTRFSLPPLFTSADILLLVLLGTASAAFYGFRMLGTEAGPAQVVLKVGENTVGRCPLARDTTFMVTGSIGSVEVVIEGGRLRFEDAPCRQKICEKMGPVANSGEMVVCAPNRVMARIEVAGKKSGEGGLDALSR